MTIGSEAFKGNTFEQLLKGFFRCVFRLLSFTGCTSLATVELQNVTVIASGAFDGDIYLDCLLSKFQSALIILLKASCTLSSSGFCAPLAGCPVQMQYSFLNHTVKGSMVANDANSFLKFDATLHNGATAIEDHLQLQSEHQQFMTIPDFSIATTELTLSFWFKAFPINEGTLCQFNSSYDGIFRVFLTNGLIVFGRELNSAQFNVFVADEWNHVAFVQSNKNQADDSATQCTWSTYWNGNPKGSKFNKCAMSGYNKFNYIGVSSDKNNVRSNYLNGSIREFRLYNSALKLSDIKSLYLSTYPTSAPTMVPSPWPTLIPSMAPSCIPTVTPTSPSAIPTQIPTAVGVVVSSAASSLSNLTIIGIVVAGFVFIVALFIIAYFFLRPKHTFMDNLMIGKQKENLKYFAAKTDKSKSVIQSTVADALLAPCMKHLTDYC